MMALIALDNLASLAFPSCKALGTELMDAKVRVYTSVNTNVLYGEIQCANTSRPGAGLGLTYHFSDNAFLTAPQEDA